MGHFFNAPSNVLKTFNFMSDAIQQWSYIERGRPIHKEVQTKQERYST